jgi:hypothetical protein
VFLLVIDHLSRTAKVDVDGHPEHVEGFDTFWEGFA